MSLIPVGRILQNIGDILADPRRSKWMFFLLVGAPLYTVVALILFVVIGTRSSIKQTESLLTCICGSAMLVMFIAGLGVVITAYQKPQSTPSSSLNWFSVSEVANQLQMTDTEVMALIKSGQLLARKFDGVYRVEEGMLRTFIASRNYQ